MRYCSSAAFWLERKNFLLLKRGLKEVARAVFVAALQLKVQLHVGDLPLLVVVAELIDPILQLAMVILQRWEVFSIKFPAIDKLRRKEGLERYISNNCINKIRWEYEIKRIKKVVLNREKN